ncbi:MAG: FkbM family methyltransferase [Thermodesulfobacteriota bacterium]
MSDHPVFNKLKPCRHGAMLYNINDQYIGKSLDMYGEYSEMEIALFDQILQPGQVVLDVGANIGAYTLYFAKKVGDAGAVHAFEPQRLVFQTLCANMALNSIVNAHCRNAALGTTAGTIRVPDIKPWISFNFGGLTLGDHETGNPVPLLRLDDLGIGACHFMKIDVEGMELEVLKGGSSLIRACNPVLYVENDRQEKSADLVAYLSELGYDLFWHLPPLYNPDNFFQNRENVFGTIVSQNMLCLPKTADYKMDGFQRVEIPV